MYSVLFMWDSEPDASLLHKPADLHIELCGSRSFRKINPVQFSLHKDRKSRYVYNGELHKTCYSLRGLVLKLKLGGLTYLGQRGWERRQLIWCKISLLTNATVCIFREWDHKMCCTPAITAHYSSGAAWKKFMPISRGFWWMCSICLYSGLKLKLVFFSIFSE